MKHNIIIRIPKEFFSVALKELRRPHPFAAERVVFFHTNSAKLSDKLSIVTVTGWESVPDADYLNDPSVGAKISGNIIRKQMERIIQTGHGCLHVHLHDHKGRPGPGSTDRNSLPQVVKAFHNANPDTVSGYLILSENSFYCQVTCGSKMSLQEVNQLTVVGNPLQCIQHNRGASSATEKLYERQGFLGTGSQQQFRQLLIGVVGLGGGGSHIAQQLAHLGFHRFHLFDADHIEPSNHNRLIGGWFIDIAKKVKKTLIAKRLIKKINPKAQVNLFSCRWQDAPDKLKQCDIIVGCIDSFIEREQLEAVSRRYLIPIVDIGMDVHQIKDYGYAISGQVILSVPGMACMKCMQFLTEKKLAQEAARYGAAGSRPQVVWSNGVLASTAVGVIVDLITGWTNQPDRKVYLSYDGNTGIVIENPRLQHCPEKCQHHGLKSTGDPVFRKI